MRKRFYSFLALMLVTIVGAMAQTTLTSLDQLSNSKAYTITSSRCFFQNVPGVNALVTSTGSVDGVVAEASVDSVNQQYAILKGDADYYLYSVGAGKFINSDGSYADAPGASTPINIDLTSDANYPFTLHYGSNYINTQVSNSGYANGYVINSWSTMDEGNQFCIVEAAEPDLSAAVTAIDKYEHESITVTVRYSLCYNGTEVASYESSTKGAAPLTISFDAPKTYLGATCSDATPSNVVAEESKTIDVVYNYTANLDELPFVPTTITDGAFAAATKWYYLSPAKKTTYDYYNGAGNSGNGAIVKKTGITSAPADAKYFFAFTGNPLSGFQIRSYTAGAEKGATADASDCYDVTFTTSPSAYAVENGTNSEQYRFRFIDYDATGLAYLDAYYDTNYMYAWSWSSGWASYTATDDDAQYYIQPVSEDNLKLAINGQLAITTITPSTGTINGGLSEVNIVFDQPIYRVYSLDHEGAGYDGEDEAKILTFTDSKGNVAQQFILEDDANGYMVNEENPNQLDIYFERPFTTTGSYTLTIPTGLVYSEDGLTNAETKLVYNVKDNFNPVTVTGRVYNAPFGDFSGTAWSILPYEENLGYYTIKVKVDSKDDVTFLGYTGAEGDDLEVNFDPSDGSILLLDNNEADSYGSYWDTSSVLDGDYAGYYIYFSPSYCNIDFSTENGYGTAAICGYHYSSWSPYYTFIDWYLDDRYAKDETAIKMESITPAEGKVESLSTISIVFERELTDLLGGTITLTDAYGNAAGGTITAELNTENAKQIDLTLSEPVTENGVYTLTVPTSLGADESEENPGRTEKIVVTYQIGEIVADTITWSQKAVDYIAPDCTNPLFAEGGQFDNITAEYYGVSNKLVLKNFMGAEGSDLTLAFNKDNNLLTINGETEDSYGSIAAYTGNSDYYFTYIYPDDCQFNLDENTGYVWLQGYFYKNENDNGAWYTYAMTWNKDVTGIANVSVAKTANTGIYNLQGMKMTGNSLKSGVYVKDGRKIVIK